MLAPVFSFTQMNHQEWRYVLMTNTIGNDRFFESIQPNQYLIKKVSHKPVRKIEIEKVGLTKINCMLINNTSDTPNIYQDGHIPVNYFTQVSINGKWINFQTYYPPICSMSLGMSKLHPHKYSKLEIDRKTYGKISLPFRITLETETGLIHSNVVTISCLEKQFKMIHLPIPLYTY